MTIDFTNATKEVMDQIVKFKDVLFQKEKGDSLKRLSTPRDSEEAASLGDFSAEVNLIGNGIKGIAQTMNFFSNTECTTLTDFIDNVFRASASKGFKRGLAIRDIIQNVKPDINMGGTGYRPAPEAISINDRLSRDQND